MNVLNRVLVLLELIVLFVLSLIGIFLLLFSRPTIQNIVEPTLTRLSDSTPNPSQIVALGVLTLLFALSTLLILLELYRGGSTRLKLTTVQGAEVLMASDAIKQQLEYALDALTDVITVRPTISPSRRGQGVDVFVELATTADIDVAGKTQEVLGITRQVLEDKLGLKVSKVQIKLDQMKKPPKRISPAPTKPTIPEADTLG